MFADFEYYENNFKGTKIKNNDEYVYLGQEASLYIKKYTNNVNEDTKNCECALVEYLQMVKQQGNIASETIPNAYSVSFTTKSDNDKLKEINSILSLYLGDIYSSVGIVKVIN